MDYAAEIKSRLDTIDVLTFYGLEIDRNGKTCCPFHGDRHPSMQVYPGDRGYFCFTCQESGDIITFVQKYFDLDFKSAIKKINDDFGLNLPIGRKMSLREKHLMEKNIRQIQEIRNSSEKAKKEAQNEFLCALDDFIRLEEQKRKYAPFSPSDELNPLFVEALLCLDGAKDRLQRAEWRCLDAYRK